MLVVVGGLGGEHRCRWMLTIKSHQLHKMSHINLMVNVMPKYRCTFTFTILFHLLLFMGLQAHDFSAYSFLRAIKYNEASTRKASLHYCSKSAINGKHYMSNVVFTNILILLFITTIIATWAYSLLLCCGDIHPHPGPVSSTSTISIDSSLSNSSCSMTNNLKVSNGAKIRNRYNQVPHLTQDTNGKVTNSQKTPQTRAKRSALSQQVTTKHI